MAANALVLFSVARTYLQALQELNAILQRAQVENRDVTDAEVNSLREGNDLLSAELGRTLRS